jgi:hypothetical protein
MSVFGALNRFISQFDAAPVNEQQSAIAGAYGFQILRNTNQETPLEPWFDFIIGINGRTIVSLARVGDFWMGVLTLCDRIMQILAFLQQRCGIMLGRRLAWECLVQR